MAKNPKRPRDPNQLAKLIADIAIGEEDNSHPEPTDAKKRKAGLKGGTERAKSLVNPQFRVHAISEDLVGLRA